MTPDEAVQRIQAQIATLGDVTDQNLDGWRYRTAGVLELIFGKESRQVAAFARTKAALSLSKLQQANRGVHVDRRGVIDTSKLRSVLEAFIEEVHDFGLPAMKQDDMNAVAAIDVQPSVQEPRVTKAPDLGDVAPAVATVFYSWQSDLPNKINRGFIEDCLKRAIKELKAEGQLKIDPCLDRDTMNVPGSPDIAATILDKIDSAALYVCDVSIINKGAAGRLTPNPNVLVELGYAIKSLGWNRVICVFNGATGRVEELPFDLRQRRVRVYHLDEQDDKPEVRKALTGVLKDDLQAAFAFLSTDVEPAEPAATGVIEPTPRVETLDAFVECQPPIALPTQPNIQHVRPQYVEGRLIWTVTASHFVDSRPGETFSVPLHRCKAWMNDRYSGTRIPITDLVIQSEPHSQVSVDDAVLIIRGPGKFSLHGTCETPSRSSGYPDIVKIDIELPISELSGKPIRITLVLHEARQGGGWPLRWKYDAERAASNASGMNFENVEVSGGKGTVGPGGSVAIQGASGGGGLTFVGGSIRGGDGGEGGGKGGDATVQGGNG